MVSAAGVGSFLSSVGAGASGLSAPPGRAPFSWLRRLHDVAAPTSASPVGRIDRTRGFYSTSEGFS
jgi:hypothetical protein